MKNIIFSIITINYNDKPGLQKTLDSVIAQSYKEFEYIIIDGGSTDGSLQIIETHESYLACWISEPDNGVYDAMNKGIKKANGEYLIFLNSGDSFADASVLQNCFEFIGQMPGAHIYYGDMYVVNSRHYPGRKQYKHPGQLNLQWLKKETINHQASLIKASLFEELGPYPVHYRLASDYWVFLKSFLSNKKFLHLGFPMVDYDFSGMSSANNEAYHKEREGIWKALVPESIDSMLVENDRYRQLMRYKVVKAAVKLNEGFQSLKGRK